MDLTLSDLLIVGVLFMLWGEGEKAEKRHEEIKARLTQLEWACPEVKKGIGDDER